MHSLLVMTVVLSSLSPSVGASSPTRLEVSSSLTLPGSQRGELHLVDTKIHELSGDEGSTGRVIVECLGGLAGEVAGAVPAYFLLANSSSLATAALGMGLMVVGNSVGVTVAGWLMDGRGSYGFALLGSFIGFVAPLLGGMALLLGQGCNIDTNTNCGGFAPMVIGMLLLPPVGGALAYELSAPDPWLSLEASRAPAPTPRVVPVLALARQGLGVTFGIAGRL